MKPLISPWRFIYVWSKRQIRIKANTLSFAFTFRKKKKEELRSGTASKRKGGFLLQGLMLLLYVLLAFNMSWQTLMRLNKVIPDSAPAPVAKAEIKEMHISFLALFDFERLERRAQYEHKEYPNKTLPEIRKELLYKDQKIFVNRKGVDFTYENQYEMIYLSLSYNSEMSPQEARTALELFIDHGVSKFTKKQSRSSFKVDMSKGKKDEFLKWIGLYFLLCLIALSFLEGIGNKNPLMMAPEDDLENLAAFPIKVWVLFLLPLLQRTFFNVMSILVSFPPAVCFFIVLGHDVFESIFLGIPVSLLFCLCTASLQICYQFLGRFNSKKWVRVACSFFQLPGYAVFCLVLMGGQIKPIINALRDVALVNPGAYIPSAMILRYFHEGSFLHLWQPILICAIFPVTALSFIHIYSKGGLPSTPMDNVKNRAATPKNSNLPQCALRLFRDRNYFIQTLVFPIMLFGFYMFMFLDRSSGIDGNKALSMLFGAVSFILLGSLLNIAAHEGPSLWLLFSASRNIADILKKSVYFWIKVIAAIYFIGIMIMFSIGVEDMPVFKSIMLIFGLPSMAFIATALSFKAYPPPSGSEPQKPKTSIIYFYMLLVSIFIQSALFGVPGSEFTSPILFGFLAYALWQDHKKTINYYLDPDYLPPRELSAKNSMVWCILFFAAQSIVFMIVLAATNKADLLSITISNGIASVVIASWAAYWYRKSVMHKIEFSDRTALSAGKQVITVLACACIFILFAWVYLKFLKSNFPEIASQTISAEQKIYLAILAVLIAPLIEEYLFRRLLLVSLLKNLSPKIAIISCALIFAAVHPISSFPPVFCLGLGASWIYWKSGSIWAAIALHALYNAGVVIFT